MKKAVAIIISILALCGVAGGVILAIVKKRGAE